MTTRFGNWTLMPEARRVGIVVAAILLLCGWCHGGTGPNLTVNSHFSIQNVQYSPSFTPGIALNGTGDIVLAVNLPTVGGVGGATPITVAKGVRFAGIVADSNGNVDSSKTGYTFQDPIPWKNVFGSGLSITLGANTGFTITKGADIKSSSTTFNCPSATIQLPCNDSNGKPIMATTPFSFTLDGSGNFQASAKSLSISGIGNQSGNGPPVLQFGGFGIAVSAPSLTVQSQGDHRFDFHIDSTTVLTPLPSLTTGTLTLNATGVDIFENGLPSIKGLAFGSATPGPVQEAQLLALLDSGFLTDSTPQNTSLGDLGVDFQITGASASVAEGQFTKLSVSGNLQLGKNFSNSATVHAGSPGSEVSIPVSASYNVTTEDLTFQYTGNGTSIFYSLSSGALLQVSLSGLTVDTKQGISHLKGTVTVTGDPRVPNGTMFTITGSNGQSEPGQPDPGASFDTSGFTGTVALQAGQGINLGSATITSGSISFQKGNLIGGSLVGNMTLTGVTDDSGNAVNLGVDVSISNLGTTVAVSNVGNSWNLFGCAELTNFSGQGAFDASSNSIAFTVSGLLTINNLPTDKPMALKVQNLTYDSQKNFQADLIALVTPLDWSYGPVNFHLSSIGIGADPNSSSANPPMGLVLDGGVNITDDSIPVNGGVTWKGLYIGQGDNGKGVKLDLLGEIGVNLKFQDFMSVTATIHPPSDSGPYQGFSNLWYADGSLTVMGVTGTGGFLIADNHVWAFEAGFQLKPSEGIPLPMPAGAYFNFYGLAGGVGHGVKLKGTDPSDTQDLLSQLAYDDANPNNLFIQATLYMGSRDNFLIWGPTTLQITFPDFAFNFDGQQAILTNYGDTGTMDPSRHADIHFGYYNGGFHAGGKLTLQLLKVITISGGFDALFDSDQGYLHVGLPIDQNGIGVTLGLSGILTASSKAGFGIDLWDHVSNPPPPYMPVFNAESETEVSVLGGLVKGSTTFGMQIGLATDQQNGPKVDLSFNAGVAGEVNFIIGSAEASASGTIELGVQFGDDFNVSGSIDGSFTATFSILGLTKSASLSGTICSWG